jgi:uncharacterized membrane protein YphA (DoxX/SURF4 family)
MISADFLPVVETLLRLALGYRFLVSGIDSIRRWPSATRIAKLVFPVGACFFAFVGVSLVALAGVGLTLGLQTRIAALSAAVFLLSTFKIQFHRLKTLPAVIDAAKQGATGEEAREAVRLLGWQAVHAHDIGWQNNLILMFAALLIAIRGATAFSLDYLFFGP